MRKPTLALLICFILLMSAVNGCQISSSDFLEARPLEFPEFNGNNWASEIAWAGKDTLYVGFVANRSQAQVYQLWAIDLASSKAKTRRLYSIAAEEGFRFRQFLTVLEDGRLCIRGGYDEKDAAFERFYLYDPTVEALEAIELHVPYGATMDGYIAFSGKYIAYALSTVQSMTTYIYDIERGEAATAAVGEKIACISPNDDYYVTGFTVDPEAYVHTGFRLRKIGSPDIFYEYASKDTTTAYSAARLTTGGKLLFTARPLVQHDESEVRRVAYDYVTGEEGEHQASVSYYSWTLNSSGTRQFLGDLPYEDDALPLIDLVTGESWKIKINADVVMSAAFAEDDRTVALICKRDQEEFVSIVRLKQK